MHLCSLKQTVIAYFIVFFHTVKSEVMLYAFFGINMSSENEIKPRKWEK